jgi:cytochrome P450
MYHLLRNPSSLDKLRIELDAAELGFPPGYKEVRDSQRLPYLEAVIKEGLRMHPTVGLCLERIGMHIISKLGLWELWALTQLYKVPEPGLTLPDGRFIPAGVIVGINPSVVTKDRTVYGPDADGFHPERWLRRYGEPYDAYTSRLQRMDELNTFVWGGGNRTCLGRFLATTSLYKVTAMLVSRYDISFEDPKEEWVLRKHWMVYNDKIKVKIQRRQQLGSESGGMSWWDTFPFAPSSMHIER